MCEEDKDLETLLRRDYEASSFYLSLPDYVKEQVKTRSHNISSFASLKDYVENLTRGEG